MATPVRCFLFKLHGSDTGLNIGINLPLCYNSSRLALYKFMLSAFKTHTCDCFGKRGQYLRAFCILPLALILSVTPVAKTSCGEPPWPVGCPHGEETLTNVEDPDNPGAYFDFSAGQIVYGDEGRARGDIYLEKTLLAGNAASGVAFHDDLADSLLYKTVAPTLDWTVQPNPQTPARLAIYNGHCVWIRTGEGNIAKIKILLTDSNPEVSSFNWIKFSWIYQPDGSNEFHDVAGAQPATQ